MLGRLRGLLSYVWHTRSLSGVTLVTSDRWTIAEELWSFGEDALYLEPLEMSDDQMVRLWSLAGKVYMRGDARSAGEAGALAAVAIIEGEQRPLARRRRRPQARLPRFEKTQEERFDEIRRIQDSDSFPEVWR